MRTGAASPANEGIQTAYDAGKQAVLPEPAYDTRTGRFPATIKCFRSHTGPE
jgi:hypothetical protein